MRAHEIFVEDASLGSEQDDLFEMANLYPSTTGLPMTVWVSPRGGARHDVRVKVNMQHGNQMNINNTAVMSVRPTPTLLAGNLSRSDQAAAAQWIIANTEALVAYWEGQIDTLGLAQRLVRAHSTTATPKTGKVR